MMPRVTVPRALSCLLAVAVLGAASAPARSEAAEITHVFDAFDIEKAWSGLLGLRFVNLQRSSLITREFICQADDNVDVNTGKNPLCPGGNRVIDTRQLASQESMNLLNIDFRAGLYHDLEFYMTLPIVIGWTSKLDYDDGVSGSNSLVSSSLRPSLFGVPFESADRAGFGDMTMGFRIAPFHEDRDPLYPSWVLGIEYLAPTGTVRTAGDSGVGGGVHAITLNTAISRRVLSWLEPYFQLHGTLRFAAGDSPFKNERITQTLVSPGHSLGLLIGTEFHPWNTPSDSGPYVSVDVAFRADFTFEGREFTEIFDALGKSPCDPAENCHRTQLTRGERVGEDGIVSPDGTKLRKTDGVTDVEQYGRFGGTLGVTYQAMRYLKVRVGVNYWHTTSHFITFADAGKDLDKQNNVEHSNSEGLNEYNPFYNENYDDFGSRFRVDGKNTFEVVLSLEGQY